MLAGAVICALLAYPEHVRGLIKTIEFPGLGKVDLATPAQTQSDVPPVRELAGQQATTRDERRLKLAKLRTAGVNVRNRALQLRYANHDWTREVGEWTKAVEETLESIDPAEAEWFRTLDVVPNPRIPSRSFDPEFLKLYRELDFRLAKLDQLLPRRFDEGHDQKEGAAP